MKLNVYTCKAFTGHDPVGMAAVVVAESALQAADILNTELRTGGLRDARSEDFHLLNQTLPAAIVLNDGNY